MVMVVRLINISLAFIATWTCAQSCVMNNHYFVDDTRNVAYHVVTPCGILQCGRLCAMEGRCVSINFQRTSLTCELVEASAGPHINPTGWTSTANFTFIQSKLGSCSAVNSGEYDVCVPLRSMAHSMVKKYCPVPPDTSQDVSLTSYSRTVGHNATYNCNGNQCYRYVDNNITCHANGQWPPEPTCEVVAENDIRLVDGTTPYAGKVQICHNAVWGTVCDHSWSSAEAKVACRQLGYSGGSATTSQPSSGQIWFHMLACTGSEASLASCQHDGWICYDCGGTPVHGSGVVCDP